MKTTGKRFAALLLAAVMLATTVFCTEVPVSAETLQATIAKSRVTTKIQEAGRYSIRIQWDMSRLASGYAVYRKENGQSYKRIATVGKNVSSYLDQNLVSATQYQYAVRAYRKENGKEVYSQYNAVLGATRPEMPKIQAQANSSRQIRILEPCAQSGRVYCISKGIRRKMEDNDNFIKRSIFLCRQNGAAGYEICLYSSSI